jgi:hypothetical protein
VVSRWTYTRTKLETADRAKEHLKPTAFSSTRSSRKTWASARRSLTDILSLVIESPAQLPPDIVGQMNFRASVLSDCLPMPKG